MNMLIKKIWFEKAGHLKCHQTKLLDSLILDQVICALKYCTV